MRSTLSVLGGGRKEKAPLAEARRLSRDDGIVRLTCCDQKSPRQDARLRCRDCIPPFVRRLNSEGPQRRSRDEMALKVEGVVNGGMHAEEALSGSSRFKIAASCALVAVQADVSSPPDCYSEVPVRADSSVVSAGTPRHRSAACRSPAISAQTLAF